MIKKIMLSAGICLLIIGSVIVWRHHVSNVEQSTYQVISHHANIEIRQYPAMIVAQVSVPGERREAIRAGFKLLADYIFGNNTTKDSIAMTAPVTQQPGQKIAMTAPVTQQPAGEIWHVRFMMPAKYTLATLPKPNKKAVQIKSIPARKLAVIRFSGFPTSNRLKQKLGTLTRYLNKHNITAVAEPQYAFYNPPWTLPFMRRNEVMLEISH